MAIRSAIEDTKEYAPHSEIVRTTPVPLGATKWTLRMVRDAWPEKSGKDIRAREVIYGQVDISYDGGLTFKGGAGVGAIGGVHVRRDGTISNETTISSKMLEPRNANRVARVTFRSASRLTTKLDLDFD